jgi:hypothetical protein
LTVGSAEPKAKLGAGLIGQKESTCRPILLTVMELSVPDWLLNPAKSYMTEAELPDKTVLFT